MLQREGESGERAGAAHVIQHKNIVNLKLEISHIKNLEIAFGCCCCCWPRLKITKSHKNSQKQRQWVGVAIPQGREVVMGAVRHPSPLPHIFNELDIKKF